MNVRRLTWLGAVLLVGAIAHAAAGCGGGNGDNGDGGLDGGLDGTMQDQVSPFNDGGCTAASCEGGICSSSGMCCASQQNLCGATCCTGVNVCLFDSCVTPGAPCHSGNDCPANWYCEPALGDDDGGIGDGGGLEAGCTESLPVEGRCLPLPPTCAGDAGTGPDGGLCIADCEYHPTPGGPLSAKTLWNWTSAADYPNDLDIWSTPTVGRIYDTNCDGNIDSLDSPVVVVVTGNTGTVNCNANGNACHTGVLRMLDGTTGAVVWSLPQASVSSAGFMGGVSIALGDVDLDGYADIIAMTGEGYIVVVDRNGNVTHTSDYPYGTVNANTGWGGGLSVADMDLDGWPEIAYADTVWTMKGGNLTREWIGGKGNAGGYDEALSAISDMDQAPDNHLELLTGNTCYTSSGTVLWQNAAVTDGFPGVADIDENGTPEAVIVGNGEVWILNGKTGVIITGPFTLPGTGSGGAPTIADFDGDGFPEIGIAQANFYSVVKPTISGGNITGMTLLWKMGNHDFSSSVTGSTVFDFEGAGHPSVIYADECWLWVFDGPTGAVRLAESHSSFTATEASILADINGDGHAEMLIPSQGVNMNTWNCIGYETGKLSINGQYWTPGPDSNSSYRGLIALGDTADSWVGTRTLWNEHTYHVSNICDDSDNACGPPNIYGSIPSPETKNWTLPWLNDFRQNVQDKGIFNAPDAIVSMTADCTLPVVAHVSVRNIGQAGLPSGVNAGVFVTPGDTQVGEVTTTYELLPGQTETLDVTLSGPADKTSQLYALILIDPMNPTFHECNTSNDQSATVSPACTQ